MIRLTSLFILPSAAAAAAMLWLAVEVRFALELGSAARKFSRSLVLFAVYPILELIARTAPSPPSARFWLLVAGLYLRVVVVIFFSFVTETVARRRSDAPLAAARTLMYAVGVLTSLPIVLALAGLIPPELLIPSVFREANLFWQARGFLVTTMPLFQLVGSYTLFRVWDYERKLSPDPGSRQTVLMLRGAAFMLAGAAVFWAVEFGFSGEAVAVPFTFFLDGLLISMSVLFSSGLRRWTVGSLKSQRDMSAMILDTMGDGLAVCGPDGVIEVANRRLADMSGYSSQELIGMEVGQLLRPEEEADGHVAAANSSRRSVKPVQRRLRRKDGGGVPILLNCAARYDADGRCWGFVNVFTDVSSLEEMTRELEAKTREISVLHEVASTASQLLDVKEILVKTLDPVMRLAGTETATAYAFDHDHRHLDLVGRRGRRGGDEVPSDRDERRIVEEVVRRRRPVFCEDISKDRSWTRSYVRPAGCGCFIALPVASKTRILGAICLVSSEPRRFAEQERQLIVSVATEIAVAVENAMLFEEAGKRGVELLLLHETGQLVTSSLDEDELYSRVVEKCAESFDAGLCVFGSLEDGFLKPRAVCCRSEKDTPLADRVTSEGPVPIDGSLLGSAVEAHEGILINTERLVEGGEMASSKAQGSGKTSGHALDELLVDRAWMMAPVRQGRVIVGLLVAATGDRTGRFSARDLFMMEEVASQLGRAAERVRLFQEIEESEMKYRSLVERASDGVFLCDTAGRIIFASSKVAQMTGRPLKSLIDSPLESIFDCESAVAMVEAMAEVVDAPDRTRIVNGTLDGPTGEKAPVQIAYAWLEVFDGVPAVQGIMRDLRQELETERLKSDLVSMVSHELRSPLTLIAGYSAMLQQPGILSDPAKRAIASTAIDAQVRRMLELVEELLLTSRIEHGTLEIAKQPVDLDQVARRFAKAYRASSDKHSVTAKFARGFPKVMADLSAMECVLANLLSNAIKYSPEGGHVVISGEVDGTRVRVTVSDEGIGVDPREQAKIFQRFYQADMTSTRSYGGMGLGLFLTKDIIEAHGGTIDVESAVGHGSKFTFTLPAELAGDGNGGRRGARRASRPKKKAQEPRA